ncbi:ETX/MTX2 family pore-forming toxin [Bacillus cereus]|nr:ETX/MTX2 family pore-forming toxin [Bacillus cereus]MEB8666859.1 ETX/MTX2 family pore-forming toxin [Bacillus cereus]
MAIINQSSLNSRIHDLLEDSRTALEKKYTNDNPWGFVRIATDRLDNYQLTNVNVSPRNQAFQTIPSLQHTARQVIENNTSVAQSQTISFNERTTDTFTTSVTTGFKTGTSVKSTTKFKISVGFLAAGELEQSVEVAVNFEYNYSSTTTETHSVERGWVITQPIIAPPRTIVEATLLIYAGSVDVPIDLNATIVGDPIPWQDWGPSVYTGAFYANDGRIWTGFVRPDELSLASSAYRPVGRTAIFSGLATTNVASGLYSVVRIDERPLPGFTGETRRYYLPPSLATPDQILSTNAFGNNVPIINPVPNAHCKKEHSPIIIHKNREEKCERDYDEVYPRHNQVEKCEHNYDEVYPRHNQVEKCEHNYDEE